MSPAYRAFLFLVPLAAGYFFRHHVRSAPIHRAVTDFLFPALVFYLLISDPPEPTALVVSSAGLLLQVLLMMPPAFLLLRALGRKREEMLLPVTFMNSGFMGIPATMIFGGVAAGAYAVLFDQAMTIAIYTIGLSLVVPGGAMRGVTAVIKAPAFWAFVAALGLGWNGWRGAEFYLKPLGWLGMLTVPCALFAVGLDLRASRAEFRAAIPAALLRLGGGAAIGLVTILIFARVSELFEIGSSARIIMSDEAFRRMLWIEAIMPSAVFSAVLPARYGAAGGLASTIVLISTLLFPFWFLILFALAPESFTALG